MGRLLRLLGGSSSGGSQLVVAGNRNRVNYTKGTTASANVMRYGGESTYAPADTAITDLRVVLDNFYAVNNAGIGTASLLSMKFRVGVEYPLDGTCYPLASGGDSNPTVAPGSRAIFSGSGSLVIPAGEQYRVRVDRESLDTGGGTYTELQGVLMAPGRHDHLTSSNDNTLIKAFGGVSYPDLAVTTLTYGVTAVLARPVTPGQKSVFLAGDSIMRGSGDTTGTTQQGDWLSGTSPSADYPDYGNAGWAERSIGIAYPYYTVAVQGRYLQSFTAVNMEEQLAVLDTAPPTLVVLGLGVNDLIIGRTAAQVLADLDLAIAVLKARYGSSTLVYVCTITPVTNSSDSWATTANQSFSGTLSGATITWSNFSDGSGATGRLLVNAQIMAGSTTADGVLDVASACQDGSDPRLWRADLASASTLDGIHPKDVQVRQIMASNDIPAILATPSAADALLLESGDYVLLEDGSKILLE
jgi:hypothetical protein